MADRAIVYVGTYTGPLGQENPNAHGLGIYCLELDTASGGLKLLNVAKDVADPSYFALNSAQTHLYAVNEVGEFNGEKTGAVSAFEIKEDLSLKLIGQKSTGDSGPCHVFIDKKDEWAYISNYSFGSFSSRQINPDGSLGDGFQLIKHESRVGAPPNPDRQESPHAHSSVVEPIGERLLVFDLGLDEIKTYAIKPDGRLEAGIPIKTAPGSGPRHCDFSSDGKFLYVIHELDSSISVYAAGDGLKLLQTISGKETTGYNDAADIHVTSDGRFLYGSNRGEETIVCFSIDQESGLLTLAGHYDCGGSWPRSFTIDTTSHFLIVANQKSDNLVVFGIDQETGALSKVSEYAIPAPVCVKAYAF
ncbi:MAG: lactonase family protein [Clostridiales bacterium]|nr:lactonase family protein [Clostridiales bacterium]